MATEKVPMPADEHAQTARDFLVASDREFDAGDIVQGSQKLWGAATHAMTAVAIRRGWEHDGHRALKVAAERMSCEYDDVKIRYEFGIAEKFRNNFHLNTMPGFEIDGDRPKVHDFVHRVLALL